MTRTAFLTVAVLCAAAVALASTSSDATFRDPAPEMNLIDLRTGETVRLSDLKGQVVLLEFWATWCRYCPQAMDELRKIESAYAAEWGDRVALIPMSVDISVEPVLPYARERGWTRLNHYWSGQISPDVKQALAVRGIPAAVLIDQDGNIAWRGHPLDTSDGYHMAQRVEQLLGGSSFARFWHFGHDGGGLLIFTAVIQVMAILVLFRFWRSADGRAKLGRYANDAEPQPATLTSQPRP